jgi:outer membrane immunogenic protein
MAVGATVTFFSIASIEIASAQSADVLARLEAKLDAIEKENAALRERIRRIETRSERGAAASEPPKRAVATVQPAVAVGHVAASAQAAAPAYVRPSSECGAYRFSGVYAGVHGGVVNYQATRTDMDGYLTAPAANTPSLSTTAWGGEIGGHLGYNWTNCNTLFGVEIDGSWAEATATRNLVTLPGIVAQVKSELDVYGTARARAGLVLDNMLLYATGGLAWAHTRTTWRTNFIGFGPNESLQSSDWIWGGAAGFGAEWAWTDRLSLRAETLYLAFADREYLLRSPTLGRVDFANSDSMWVTRAALNYRFGH